MKILDQIQLAGQLREAHKHIADTVRKEGVVVFRDLLLKELGEKIKEPLTVVSDLSFMRTQYKELNTHSNPTLNTIWLYIQGGVNQLAEVDGLGIDIKAPYSQDSLRWSLTFSSQENMAKAIEVYGLNLDFGYLRDRASKALVKAKESVDGLEKLTKELNLPGQVVPVGEVDWLDIANGKGKAPQYIKLDAHWIATRCVLGKDPCLPNHAWIYVCPGNGIEWDSCAETSARGFVLEQAINSVVRDGYTALYQYQGDETAELIHVNLS